MAKENKNIYVAPTLEEMLKMTKAEQKVVIARDVLAMIKAGKYIPTSGSYIASVMVDGREMNISVKENFDKLKRCEVCAVGACLLSITKFKNKLSFIELPQAKSNFTPDTLELLQSVFTPKELMAMEMIFEQSTAGDNIGRDLLGAEIDEVEQNRLENIYSNTDRDEEAEERLVCIMENIIEHNGRLVF